MKLLSYFFLWIAAASLVTLGCERHSFKDTKKLHEDHGHGDHDDHGDHGDKHDDHGDHGDKHDGHGDKHDAKDDASHEGDHGDGKKEKKKADAKEKPRDTGI